MSRPSRARIRDSFERAAPTYGAAAVVQRRVCTRLAAGLPAAISARRILDAGCGTGFALPLLHQRYPAACSIALHFALLVPVAPPDPPPEYQPHEVVLR